MRKLICGGVWFFLLISSLQADELRFELKRIVVDGNTLLSDTEIARAVQSYIGKDKSFADVQRALDAVQKLYLEHGFGAVEVTLPEQELSGGEVHLKAIEAKVADIVVEGNKEYSRENVKRSIPSVRQGKTPKGREIAQDLRLANLNPGKRSKVVLREGQGEGDIDVLEEVSEQKVKQFALSLDNTGTGQTGNHRVGLGFRDANLFDRDQVLNLSYLTSLQRPSNVSIFGAGYQIPLYGHAAQLDFTAGYSNVNSGVVQNLFNVSGSGVMYGAHYTYLVPAATENIDQRIGLGVDYRSLSNNVTLINGATSLIPSVTVHPVSLSYDGIWKFAEAEAGVHVSVSQNVGSQDAMIKPSRSNGKAAYRIYRAGANFWQSFANDWQFKADWHGQWTSDALINAEQFGAGGAYSVRGFNEREATDDNGYTASLELYGPEEAKSSLRVRPLLFADYGKVWRNFPLLGEAPRQIIGSFGAGLRGTIVDGLNFRLDYARVVDSTLTGNAHKNGDQMLHFGVVYLF